MTAVDVPPARVAPGGPSTTAQHALDRLRRAIVEGTLRPGARIVQEDVAELLGVSVAPVREALRVLEQEGQVTYRPRRGYTVAELRVADLEEIYELRRVLEERAARRALPALDEEAIERIAGEARECVDAAARGDVTAELEANRRFHFAILDAAGQVHAMRVIRLLWDSTEAYRAMYYNSPREEQAAADAHERILAGDPARRRRRPRGGARRPPDARAARAHGDPRAGRGGSRGGRRRGGGRSGGRHRPGGRSPVVTADRSGVVVVGAINVDLVVAAPRLPGPGETVVGARLERHGGGKGANAAVAAARAGAAVRLVGAVGTDDNGTAALDDLRAPGVEVGDVAVLDGEPTGVALIVVDPAGENQIAVGAGANAAVTAAHVRAALRAALPGTGCVLVSTEIAGEAVVAAIEEAAAAGVRCVLNPAPAIPAVLERAPARAAADPERHGGPGPRRAARGRRGRGDDGPVAAGDAAGDDRAGGRRRGGAGDAPVPGLDHVVAAAQRLIAATGAPVVVTLGGDGALVLEPGAPAAHVPPRPATVRDTTGAGDTFNGVLAVRLAAGDALAEAVDVASAAAALSVGEVGARAGMPDAAAIEAATRPRPDAPRAGA